MLDATEVQIDRDSSKSGSRDACVESFNWRLQFGGIKLEEFV